MEAMEGASGGNSSDRNPSPPLEILNDEDLVPDRIGDSLYSKKWLIKTLMKIVEACEASGEEAPAMDFEKEQQASSDANPAFESIEEKEKSPPCGETADNGDQTEMVELDPKIEEKACALWDMTTTKDVSTFLCDSGVPEGIFVDIINRTKSPRLLEIILGILGNMSSFDSSCRHIAKNQDLVNSVILLSGTSDSPSLLQVFRIILCGISKPSSRQTWYSAFEENPFFMDNLKFILENSLTNSVLQTAYQLIYTIMNHNLEYCKIWGEPVFLSAIIEAGKQIKLKEESLDNFFCVLNCLCQYTPNKEALIENWSELDGIFNTFFLTFLEEEVLPNRDRINGLYSCFEVYCNVVSSDHMSKEIFKIDIDALTALSKVSNAVNTLVLDIRRDNLPVVDLQNPIQEPPQRFLRRTENRNGVLHISMLTEKEFRTWSNMADILVKTAKSLMDFAEKESEKDILTDIISGEIIKENVNILII